MEYEGDFPTIGRKGGPMTPEEQGVLAMTATINALTVEGHFTSEEAGEWLR